jgi:hypothetical protein
MNLTKEDIVVGMKFKCRTENTVYEITKIYSNGVRVSWSEGCKGTDYGISSVVNYFNAGDWILETPLISSSINQSYEPY